MILAIYYINLLCDMQCSMLNITLESLIISSEMLFLIQILTGGSRKLIISQGGSSAQKKV